MSTQFAWDGTHSKKGAHFSAVNEFIYANEGKLREIAQVVHVTQTIMKDYTIIKSCLMILCMENHQQYSE
jgi:hypothetical protein